ncbi:hypothetical protein [Arsenophonus sp.]|uniref:hypothetical protein n=1 Tax=Arsenophonus sp. TaxID=1872640 RepID=UPI00285E3944|nr:hypothetical protein [Arsenophonus sp.]MDR5610326.1 hypothetical protein [Arsenophonus sp.]
MDIHVRFAQGQSLRKIASELGISRNTVTFGDGLEVVDVYPVVNLYRRRNRRSS